jgi:transketolase
MDNTTFSYELKKIILQQSKRARMGHIGSSLSIADIMTVLYNQILYCEKDDWADRDRFVLSKGHAALALYGALCLKGLLSKEQLSTYCTDGTYLGAHPETSLPAVDFSTGSLGQGLSVATGFALAAKMKKKEYYCYVVASDAECNEGAFWEAVMFAAHHKLSRLILVIDVNKQQALDFTKDILDLSPLMEKFTAFGWNAYDVDGHNHVVLEKCLRSAKKNAFAPQVILANTVFGKGVSFMEGQIKWHYLSMTDAEYTKALTEIER